MLTLPLDLDENQQENIRGMSAEYPYTPHSTDHTVFSVPWHWHEELEFNYIEKGSIEVTTNSCSYIIHEGEGYFVNANVLNCKKKTDGAGVTLSSEHLFHPILLSGYFRSIYEKRYVDPIIKNRQIEIVIFSRESENGRLAIRKLKELTALQKKEHVEFETRNLLSEIWLCLINEISSGKISGPRVNLQNQDRIRCMMTYIHLHYTEKISLHEVADSADVSERECLRCFQKNLGRSPFDYIAEYRLRISREQLRTSDASVTDIALRTGFSSSAYFGKLFKKYYGMTPGEYRETYGEKKN